MTVRRRGFQLVSGMGNHALYSHASSCIFWLTASRIPFLFLVDFGAHMYFLPTTQSSENLLDFLPLSMHGTEKFDHVKGRANGHRAQKW